MAVFAWHASLLALLWLILHCTALHCASTALPCLCQIMSTVSDCSQDPNPRGNAYTLNTSASIGPSNMPGVVNVLCSQMPADKFKVCAASGREPVSLSLLYTLLYLYLYILDYSVMTRSTCFLQVNKQPGKQCAGCCNTIHCGQHHHS